MESYAEQFTQAAEAIESQLRTSHKETMVSMIKDAATRTSKYPKNSRLSTDAAIHRAAAKAVEYSKLANETAREQMLLSLMIHEDLSSNHLRTGEQSPAGTEAYFNMLDSALPDGLDVPDSVVGMQMGHVERLQEVRHRTHRQR